MRISYSKPKITLTILALSILVTLAVGGSLAAGGTDATHRASQPSAKRLTLAYIVLNLKQQLFTDLGNRFKQQAKRLGATAIIANADSAAMRASDLSENTKLGMIMGRSGCT